MVSTTMGFVDSGDQARVSELERQGYSIVLAQPGPNMTTNVLLARKFKNESDAERAALDNPEMVKTVNPPYYLALTAPVVPAVPGLPSLTKKERKQYMKTVTAMSRVLEFHGWAWLALAIVGTGALIGTLITALFILDDAVEKAGVLDGWELSILVFVMAIFVISPAVLLILGRPLTNLDTWMPGAKPEKEEAEGDTGDDKK